MFCSGNYFQRMAHRLINDLILISLLFFLACQVFRTFNSNVLSAVLTYLDTLVLFIKANILHFLIFDLVSIDLNNSSCSFVSFLFSISELSQTAARLSFALWKD